VILLLNAEILWIFQTLVAPHNARKIPDLPSNPQFLQDSFQAGHAWKFAANQKPTHAETASKQLLLARNVMTSITIQTTAAHQPARLTVAGNVLRKGESAYLKLVETEFSTLMKTAMTIITLVGTRVPITAGGHNSN